jgi:hypothetical protein
MPIYRKDNPYQGVNAHFNSLLQNMEGGWLTFHSDHIIRLKDVINRALPSGYYAVSEQSLQIQIALSPPARARKSRFFIENLVRLVVRQCHPMPRR